MCCEETEGKVSLTYFAVLGEGKALVWTSPPWQPAGTGYQLRNCHLETENLRQVRQINVIVFLTTHCQLQMKKSLTDSEMLKRCLLVVGEEMCLD